MHGSKIGSRPKALLTKFTRLLTEVQGIWAIDRGEDLKHLLEPLLLTNLEVARASKSQWWIAQIYLTRWKIEETFRFLKQSYRLEDIRVLRYQQLQKLVVLVTAAAYFAATLSGPETQAKNPLREAARYFIALLRHSTLPLLRARRGRPANSREVQPQPTNRTAS
ncbi:MAG: transposase [Terriglobia bacterium]